MTNTLLIGPESSKPHVELPLFLFTTTKTLSKNRYQGALASRTGATTTTPQIENFIGRVRINKRAARAARTYE